ncbi:MAG: hydroxymethylbilane synthase [Chloroflexi bacterium]|nr:hydroxymethylbilane synthase [Chloroflexota bacterium]
MTRLILGTRGSRLALAQSTMIADALRVLHPGLELELRVISTQGDRVLDVALSAVGDKGLFVKELEQALLAHEVDFCVHSCKDLPSIVPDGLILAAFPARVDPRDVLVVRESASDATLATLPHAAVVGTSSLRRACQLRALRPDLALRDVRGNVDTRLRKLAAGQYDALILASAGVTRLGLLGPDGRLNSDGASFRASPIPAETMLPAVAQGTLAIECRAADARTLALLAPLDDGPSRAAALAERAFLRRLEGGCQVPIAAYATPEAAGAVLRLRGLVGALDGATVIRGEQAGPSEDAELLGLALAEELLAQGAAEILSALTGRVTG